MKFIDVNLRDWFPPNNELAIKIGRLCILREDLKFELDSASPRNVPISDEYGYPWRLLYFLRKMSITLDEIHKTIEGLSKDSDFKIFLTAQSKYFKKDFDQLKKDFNLASNHIKDIRDSIGAHILESRVKDALQNMSPAQSGVLQVSPQSPEENHYKFTGEFLLAVMFRNVPVEREHTKEEKLLEEFFNPVDKLLYRIDSLFLRYAKDRKLI